MTQGWLKQKLIQWSWKQTKFELCVRKDAHEHISYNSKILQTATFCQTSEIVESQVKMECVLFKTQLSEKVSAQIGLLNVLICTGD